MAAELEEGWTARAQELTDKVLRPLQPNLVWLRIQPLELAAFDAFEGNLDRFDETVLVKVHLVNAHDTVVSVPGAKRMPVINDEPFVLLLVIDDRMVSGTCSYFRILLQYLAYPLERT